MKKRICALLAALLLAAAFMPGEAWAAATAAKESSLTTLAAESLYKLGLFRGVGDQPDGSPDFDLKGGATRGAAVTMLVRLLGAEEEALSGAYSHLFTDAGWADPYIGYAYAMHITEGTSATTFGTNDPITTSQFLTLMLRAMGYSEVDWRDPYPLADLVGLEYFEGECLRGRMAYICYTALFCQVQGESMSLRQKLASQGVVRDLYAAYPYGPVTPLVTTVTAEGQGGLLAAAHVAAEGRYEDYVYFVGAAERAVEWYDYLGENIFEVPSLYSVGLAMRGDTFMVRLDSYDSYRIMAYLEGKTDTLSEVEMATLSAAMAVYDSVVKEGMSQFEIVKAFHDYLVNNTTYGTGVGELCYQAAGPLLEGVSVCDGYTRAFDLLCYLAGIECMRVVGVSGENHAWNKVKVDGAWYNIDVTWDDPVNKKYHILCYEYFLVSDDTLSKDHTWAEHSFYPDCPEDWESYEQYQGEKLYTER